MTRQRRTPVLLAGAAAVFVVSFVPRDAEAACLSSTGEICVVERSGLGDTVLDTRIEAVDGETTQVRVIAVHGESPSHAEGALLSIPHQQGDAVGSRVFVWTRDGELAYQPRITAEGLYPTSSQGDFSITADEVLELAFLPDCRDKLLERGFVEPVCDDTRSGPFGCSAAGSGLLPLPLMAVLLPFLRRRFGQRG